MWIGPAEPARDYPGIAALHSAYNWDFRDHPLTPQQLLEWDAVAVPGRVRRQFVARDRGGDVVGSSLALRGDWLPPGRFFVTALVRPELRGRGTGDGLLRAAIGCAAEHGATSVETEALDNDAATAEFLRRRGFASGHRRFKSTLDLATVDVSAVVAPPDGVYITTYAQAGDDEANRRALYELACRGEDDEPASTGAHLGFDEFCQRTVEHHDYPHAAQLIARTDSGAWIGLARLAYYPDSAIAHHELTCVDRPYRGRGIAQALKWHAIGAARRLGATRLTTTNDSRNAAMLAINGKLGFRPEVGTIQFIRELP
jgi:GNAT superfamily N-acetyltransferase